MTGVLVPILLGATAVAGLRWLRVAQREHYLPGTVTRFALRWWTCRWENAASGVVAVAASAGTLAWPPLALVPAAVTATGPLGLALRGRSAPLAWTARARRLAAANAVLVAAVVALGAVLGTPLGGAVVAALAAPLLTDVATALARPLEARLAAPFVAQARRRLAEVAPRVVAITGSYGKTSTKAYVRHLLAGRCAVVASPASFNNTLGLARAVNDGLVAGTEVFVAEMGTYGPGEIADLCSWMRPTVSVITAVGPVHLERFGSLEAIVAAKSEILAPAEVAVVNGDEPLLALAAGGFGGRKVLRCSAIHESADVSAIPRGDEVVVRVGGRAVGSAGRDVFPMNLACAVAVVLALEVPVEAVAARLSTLPSVEHRRQVVHSPSGVTVIDDTYNANPVGAAEAVELLASSGEGRRVLVTPGMVELGHRQGAENAELGRRAAAVATDVVVVGRTNRRSLIEGAAGGPAQVTLVATREEAVAWARRHLVAGDAVLYENDLPDHFP